MFSGDDQSAQGNNSNDFLIAVGKSLNLEDQSTGQPYYLNGREPSDKDVSDLKARLPLHDDKELHSAAGVGAVEPPIGVDEINRRSDDLRAVGRRLVRTVAFGVLTAAIVGVGFAWHFYGYAHSANIVDSGKTPSALMSMQSPGSNVPVEQASKTSDRVPTQDQAALLAEDQPVLPTQQAELRAPDQVALLLPPEQVSVAPGSSPELQDQLRSIMSDVAVVRRILERLAAVQEQMALDVVTLQKFNQAKQKASLLPHAPAVPSRKYAPNIARSEVGAPSLSVLVPSAPARTPSAPH